MSVNKKSVNIGRIVSLSIDRDYQNFFETVKTRVRSNRLRAALAVNCELIELYWYIGQQILLKQSETNWGEKLIKTLSRDLQNAFPETRGFSIRNIYFMCQFAKVYPDLQIVKQSVSQLPWGQVIVLIQRVKDSSHRNWYAAKLMPDFYPGSIAYSY